MHKFSLSFPVGSTDSFGVVLLELLSGKKAIMEFKDGQPTLVTDWAWSLVREGRALDVLEDSIPHLGPPEVMEKYVLVAVLCSHPEFTIYHQFLSFPSY